jgi:hypothetical protein
MSIEFSGAPDTIKVREGKNINEWRPVTIDVDDGNFLFLTIEQARSLWHEFGAVFQSEEHNEKFGHPLDECAGTPDA